MRTKHLATKNELSQNLVTTAWANNHPTTYPLENKLRKAHALNR